MAIEPAHRTAVWTETKVSMAINALVPAAIIWLIGKTPPETLVGPHPIVNDLTPAAGLATFAMTLILTLIVRARVRRGAAPALDWSRAQRGAMRYLPQNLFARALVLGVLAVLALVPLGLAAAALLGVLPLTRIGFLVFNIGFGAVVGFVMTRFVVLAAMADPAGLGRGGAGSAASI